MWVTAINCTDLIHTQGNDQENINVHLTSYIVRADIFPFLWKHIPLASLNRFQAAQT